MDCNKGNDCNGNCNVLDQLKDDPFVRLCWVFSLIKFGFLALGALGTFIYVVVKCAIDKM